jgi:hypothetical protein
MIRMYGFAMSTTATEYQASIAQASSKWATALLMTELAKTTELRIWHHECLTALAWADHPRGCHCPLDGLRDPAMRVRAASRAITRFVDALSSEQALDPLHLTRRMDAEETAEIVKNSSILASCVGEVLAERSS